MIEFYELTDEEEIPFRCDVNMELSESAPQPERSWLLWLFVKASDPAEEGFVRFREELANKLETELDAVFAGSLSKEGWIELYFYAPDAKRFENLSSEVMSAHGGFAYERGASRDTKWEMYLERLYPDAYALLRIQNRHTLEALEEAGDDHAIAREVEHYLFFQTKSALERVVSSLSSHGFSLKEEVGDNESDYAYGAVLAKTEPVTPEQVEETTAVLFDAALEQHGYYEGWSTVLAQ
ncbi:MAG: DUF695 domain-containing protein [Sulfuricurvum sp.]